MTSAGKVDYYRLTGIILVGLYFYSCISHLSDWHFIDNIDLVIHEAGHVLFIFFGQFIQILGGSLLQILVPAVFSSYFFLKMDYYSGSLLLSWVGYNIVNVSVYVKDAIVMQLPLLGGDSVIHDWNYILSQLNVIQYTNPISYSVYCIGLIVIIVAVVLGLQFSLKKTYL